MYGCEVLATAEAIDPISRIFRAAAISRRRAGMERLAGAVPGAGFVLGVSAFWVSIDMDSHYSIAPTPHAASEVNWMQEIAMPREIDWTDVLEIGIQLQEMFPDTDPYSVRFTDMHKWVTQLPGFVGDPTKSNESLLEAIQTAWHEEYIDAKDA
jgi:FeS assembly protein IscX